MDKRADGPGELVGGCAGDLALTHQLVEFDEVSGVVVATVVCSGLFGTRGVELAEALLDRASGGATLFVMDLQNVESIDSMFLGAMVEVQNRLTKTGGKLVLANAGRYVFSVFRVTKVDALVPIRPSVLEALALISGQSSSSDDAKPWLGGRR